MPQLDLSACATRFGVCLFSAWGNRWGTTAMGEFKFPIKKEWCKPDFLKNKLLTMFGRESQWLNAQDSAKCQNWELTLKGVQPEDLVYFDPPYPETLGYGKQIWTIGHLVDVIDWVALHLGKVSIVVSNTSDVGRLFRRVGLAYTMINGPKVIKTRQKRNESITYSIRDGVKSAMTLDEIFK